MKLLPLHYNIPMQDVVETELGEAQQISTPQAVEQEREDIQEMACAVEALLFASADMIALNDLRRILAIRQPTLDRVLDHLGRTLSEGKPRGTSTKARGPGTPRDRA